MSWIVKAAFREVFTLSHVIAALISEMQTFQALLRTCLVVTLDSCQDSYDRHRVALYGHAVPSGCPLSFMGRHGLWNAMASVADVVGTEDTVRWKSVPYMVVWL